MPEPELVERDALGASEPGPVSRPIVWQPRGKGRIGQALPIAKPRDAIAARLRPWPSRPLMRAPAATPETCRCFLSRPRPRLWALIRRK